MTNTYRLTDPNPMLDDDAVAPALQTRHVPIPEPVPIRRSSKKKSARHSLKHLDALDLFRGLLLIAILVGVIYQRHQYDLLSQTNSPIEQNLTQPETTQPWLLFLDFHAGTSWDSFRLDQGLRIHDYLFSGFLFALGSLSVSGDSNAGNESGPLQNNLVESCCGQEF